MSREQQNLRTVESYIASNPRRRKTNNSNFIASKMSTFSPYDVFMDMVENLDVSASHRSSSQRSIDVESLDDSITFDSDTLNEFGNVVSMASLIQNQTDSYTVGNKLYRYMLNGLNPQAQMSAYWLVWLGKT